MDTYKKDLRKVYNSMVWEKKTISEEEEENEIIKIDPNSKFGNPSDKIAIIIIKSEKPLQGNPIVVFGHGNGERAIDYLGFSKDFCPHGISVCCVDYRGYGYADGSIGTGASEPDDMITVINYLKNNGYQKISYFGFSLGARCGLYVASTFPDLVCVALDSPWLSNREWSEHKAKYFHHVDHDRFEKVLPEVYEKIKIKTGIDLNQVQEAREIVHKIAMPFYLFHGSEDVTVPYSNSVELIDLVSSKDKKFETEKIYHDYCPKRVMKWGEMFNFILKNNGVILDE